MTMIHRVLDVDDFTVLRAVGTNERIVEARALKYAKPYEVTDNGGRSFYHEVWRAGVFAKSISERGGDRGGIPMHWHHQRHEKPYGAVVGVVDSTVEFIFRSKIVKGERGDEMLELVELGAVNGVSVGATPLRDRAFNGGVERVEAKLNEISFTSHAQILDGEILAIRAVLLDGTPVSVGQEEQEEGDDGQPPVETPELDAARQYLASLERP